MKRRKHSALVFKFKICIGGGFILPGCEAWSGKVFKKKAEVRHDLQKVFMRLKTKVICNVNRNGSDRWGVADGIMAKLSAFAIRSKYTIKVIILIVLLLFFYCEFVSYWILPLTWMNQPQCPAANCRKLLLVSDPQIIGPEWKRIFLLDILAIWDSDRYLRRTFVQAVNYLQPDIILFLGDLMDQGHTATDQEFEFYKKRLKLLFQLPDSLKNAKVILAPGDNDIGGVEDILVPANVQRFEKAFNQTEECELTELIEFCKVNVMTSVIQESKFISSNIIRVAVTHVPLTSKNSYFLKEVVKRIRPNLIFSGHEHTSSHYTAYENDVWSYKHSSITPQETRPKTYKFHEGFIHEIVVPTCSYRMGVYNMGYGAAFVDAKEQRVYYNVLWLPHRYKQLLIYSVILLPVLVWFLIILLKRTKAFLSQLHSKKSNKLFASSM